MSTPLFLLLGLTLATCVIAYWADNLGKKLGKKRVTLFGLRPRQTATLITMFSSVCIMCFTLAALLLVNSGLRRALLHYDDERAANLRLRTSNRQLRGEQQGLKAQSEQSHREAENARREAESARGEAEKNRYAASKAAVQLKTSATQLKSEQANLKLAQAQEQLARRGEKAAKQRERAADRRLSAAKRQLAGVEAGLQRARSNLRIAQRDKKQAVKDARTANDQAGVAKDSARAQAKESLRQIGILEETAVTLQKQIDASGKQLAGLRSEIALLEVTKEQLRDLAFDAQLGAVFAARTISPQLSAAGITAQVRALISEGERALKANNPSRSLRLVVLPDNASEATRLAADDIIEALVRYLMTFKSPVSVRLTSTRNHAVAENEIHAALVPVSARLVFARNEVVTSMAIGGGQSDARVFNQLLKLLNRGEVLARERGVAPLLKGEELFYSADTNERIFEVLRRIRAANAPVTVRMIADADISAIDQLSVRFELVAPEL